MRAWVLLLLFEHLHNGAQRQTWPQSCACDSRCGDSTIGGPVEARLGRPCRKAALRGIAADGRQWRHTATEGAPVEDPSDPRRKGVCRGDTAQERAHARVRMAT